MTFNTHDQVPDSPTNTFATLNPLNLNSSHSKPTDGNLKIVGHAAYVYNGGIYSNISVSKNDSNLYYAEFACLGSFNSSGYYQLGIGTDNYQPTNSGAQSKPHYDSNGIGFGASGTSIVSNNTNVFTITTSFSVPDTSGIWQILVKGSTGEVWFGKNNTLLNSGSPVASISGDYEHLSFFIEVYTPSDIWYANFGQDSSFGGNKTSGSANATDANGLGDFYYSPPTGALALCNANLPDPNLDPNVDDLSEDNMKTVIWTGDNNNGRQIDTDGVGTGTGFQPDMVWIAIRTGTAGVQCTTDSVRGVDSILSTNQSNADSSFDASWRSSYGQLTEFNSTGFKVNKGSSSSNFNSNNNTYVGWSFRAGGAPSSDGVAMVDGTATTCSALATSASASITPTRMSVNTKAGFSIIKAYTTNVQANDMTESVPHGLTQTPHFVISKPITLSHPWMVYHKNGFNGNAPNNLQGLQLNSSNPQFTNSTYHTVEVTNSVIKFGRQTIEFNNNYIVFYVWHSVPGYSAFGSYTGNASANGPFVYTGFKPAFVLLKHSTGSNQHWWLYDNKRDPNNYVGRAKYANLSSNEGSQSEALDFLSNGFRITSNSNVINGTGQNCIYMAFAEQPGKYSNAR